MKTMKTDELIRAIAADAVKRPSPARVLILAALAGTIASIVAFSAALGVRDDLAMALATWRFDVKLG